MRGHRRDLLTKVAHLYKQEKDEFYQKYRLFQLHKWEILKVVKAQMLAQKIKENAIRNHAKQWIIQAFSRKFVVDFYGRFDRERDMVEIRRRMLLIAMRIKMKLRKRIKVYGSTYEDRERKFIRNSITSLPASCFRPVIRERAKRTLIEFFQMKAGRELMIAKFQKFNANIILFQRIVSLGYKIRHSEPFEWQKTLNEDKDWTNKAARGLRMIIIAIYSSSCSKQKEFIRQQEEYTKQQYEHLDAIRH